MTDLQDQRFKIVLTGDINTERMDELQAIAPTAELVFCANQGEVSEQVADARIVAGFVSASDLGSAAELEWVHSWAAGPNDQLFPEMLAHPALLTCSKGNGAIPLAEHALMLMMMLNRDAMSWIEAQRERQWRPRFHGELAGLTCGIIGTGNAGRDLALKARACHMNVVGLSRSGARLEGFDRVYSPSELHAFLPVVDFVVVTTPDTPETRDMLGEAEFRLMRDSAFYICISRGGVANDAALLTALNNKWIAGAGLDAHAIEPLPQDSPFWDAPNTIVTPHNGATTLQTKARGYEIFRENLKQFVAGGALTHIVDKSAGY